MVLRFRHVKGFADGTDCLEYMLDGSGVVVQLDGSSRPLNKYDVSLEDAKKFVEDCYWTCEVLPYTDGEIAAAEDAERRELCVMALRSVPTARLCMAACQSNPQDRLTALIRACVDTLRESCGFSN
jgi:hypothetical protein